MDKHQANLAEYIEANDYGQQLTGGHPIEQILAEWEEYVPGITLEDLEICVQAGVYCAWEAPAFLNEGKL